MVVCISSYLTNICCNPAPPVHCPLLAIFFPFPFFSFTTGHATDSILAGLDTKYFSIQRFATTTTKTGPGRSETCKAKCLERGKKRSYKASKRSCAIETRVHLGLTMIKSHGHLDAVIDSLMTSVFGQCK